MAKNLKEMRKAAPDSDLDSEALSRPPKIPSRVDTQPETIEELRAACGEWADAAVEYAEWCAVMAWRMMRHPETITDHSQAQRLSSAVMDVRRSSLVRANFPLPKRLPDPFAGKSLDEITLRLCLAAQAKCEWEAAGKPYLFKGINYAHEDFRTGIARMSHANLVADPDTPLSI